MSVVRVNKNKNYTTMSNYHLRDKTISCKAKGLLSFMLSLPDDWDYSINGLAALNLESVKAIRNILDELKQANYVKITQIRMAKGRFKYEYDVYEIPYTEGLKMDISPDTHLGYAVEGHAVEGMQLNTNIPNTNNKDKIDKTINGITKELIKRNFIEITDLDLYYYDDLFNDLLNKYEYREIIVSTNYTLRKFKENKGFDEDGNVIENKFSYFKTSLINNLEKMLNDNGLGWG